MVQHGLVGGEWLPFMAFSHILGIIIPIDFHIFQRGGPTTNQMALLEAIEFDHPIEIVSVEFSVFQCHVVRLGDVSLK